MFKIGYMMFEEDWENFIKIVEEFINRFELVSLKVL